MNMDGNVSAAPDKSKAIVDYVLPNLSRPVIAVGSRLMVWVLH